MVFSPPHCLVSCDHFNCPSSKLSRRHEGGPSRPVLFLISPGHHHRVLSSLAHPFLLSHISSLISPSPSADTSTTLIMLTNMPCLDTDKSKMKQGYISSRVFDSLSLPSLYSDPTATSALGTILPVRDVTGARATRGICLTWFMTHLELRHARPEPLCCDPGGFGPGSGSDRSKLHPRFLLVYDTR